MDPGEVPPLLYYLWHCMLKSLPPIHHHFPSFHHPHLPLLQPWNRFRHGSWRSAERWGTVAVFTMLKLRGLPRADPQGPRLLLPEAVLEEHVLPLLPREDYARLGGLGHSGGGAGEEEG